MSQRYHFIHERGSCPLLAIEEIVSVWTTGIKKAVGYVETPIFLIYQNGLARIYSYQSRYNKIVNHVFKKINQDKKYVLKTKDIFIKKSTNFLTFLTQLTTIDFRELNNEQLIDLKERYVRFYHQTAPYGEPLPYFLKEKLQKILDDYFINQLKISYQDYETLIAPTYQTFIEREKYDLLKIAQKVKYKKKEEIDELLEKHTQRYEWILFDYASLKVDKEYFKERLKEFLKAEAPKTRPQLIKYKNLKKKNLVRKYKINPLFYYYLRALEDLYFLMDYKKEVLTKAHFYITPLYQEAGRRVGLNLNEVRWLSWQELKTALTEKKRIFKQLIKKRRKFSGIKFLSGRTIFLTLKQLQFLILDIGQDEKIEKVKEIVGISGSPGKVRGIICYLKSARECSNMKEGEILLVSNTTPDFMPAIRKAKAIITNEGGITCHAAIVSRELKIPCINGTRIATKVLKDGDLVEVDAERGIVKILKKKGI